MEIIFKPTHRCNGNCVYCSAGSYTEEVEVFPKERIGPLFGVLRKWLEKSPRRNMRFIWHGGEPLLCGRDFYEHVMLEQRRVFDGDLHRVRNTFQSNITLLTIEWIPLLKEMLQGQSMGTSFDLVEGVRGLKSGENVADRWLKALHILRSNGISTGLVYTVHKKSLGAAREIYYFFRNLDPTMSLRFNPMYLQGSAKREQSAPLHVTAEEYGRFLLDLYEVWKADGMRVSTLAPVEEWFRAWRGDYQQLCCDSRGHCHETHIGINPDGMVYGCGRASDDCAHPLGNVFTDDFEEILNRDPRGNLGARSEGLRETSCKDCPYWNLCHGGCPMLAWLYYGDLFRETYFCASRKMVYAQYEKEYGPPVPPRTVAAAGKET